MRISKKRAGTQGNIALENQRLILYNMQDGVWYKAADFETIVSVKESRIKELLKGLTEKGKIESIGSTKGKMYRKR